MRCRWGTAIACAISVAVASCTDYGTADPPASDAGIDQSTGDAGAGDATGPNAGDGADAGCPAETCEGRAACTLHDFASGCGNWTFSGDLINTTHECTGGKLRLAARDTADIEAKGVFATPSTPYAVRIAARVELSSWDGGRLLRVVVGGSVLAEVHASTLGGGGARFSLCDPEGQCGAETTVSAGEHLVVLDIASGVATASVDCISLGMKPVASPLLSGSALDVLLGKVDPDSIDGVFDDVLVWYGL